MKKIKCPKCGGTDHRVTAREDTITVWYTDYSEEDKNVLEIGQRKSEEVMDRTEYTLNCYGCGKNFPLPDGWEVKEL